MKTGWAKSADKPKLAEIIKRTTTRTIRPAVPRQMNMPSKLTRVRVQLGLFVLFLAVASPVLAQSGPRRNEWQLGSPNGNVTVHVRLAASLFYSVSFRGQEVVAESKLGLEFVGTNPERGEQLKFVNAVEGGADTSWSNPVGKNNPVRDHFKQIELAFELAGGPARKMDLVFRAYDDGAAFRYRLPSDGQKRSLVLTKEDTEFHFATDPTVWASTYEGFKHPYEHEYPKAKLSSIYSSSLIGLPLLVQTAPSTYVAIAEADLTNWAGLYVKRASPRSGTLLAAQLAPRLDGSGLVKTEIPTESPWRVLMLGSKPGDLIQSDLIVNLNPPSAIADTSWIRPGKIAWDHWWSGDVKMDNETEKRFISFRRGHGFSVSTGRLAMVWGIQQAGCRHHAPCITAQFAGVAPIRVGAPRPSLAVASFRGC